MVITVKRSFYKGILMKTLHTGYLPTMLMLISFGMCSVRAMENANPITIQTPDQVVLTIRASDNPEFGPLKVELNVFADTFHSAHQQAKREIKRKRDDDAAAGAAQLVSPSTVTTPFNTPAKPKRSGEKRRPAAILTQTNSPQDTGAPTQSPDNSVGTGILYDSHFQSLPQPEDALQALPPSLSQEKIEQLQKSIERIKNLSDGLLSAENNLTQKEKNAVWSLRASATAALGAGAGALAWAATINPARIYRESCSNKFATGLELAPLVAVGKALFGPVVAIIGIGILWYKFKQWVVEPYQEAHKAEIDKFRKELATHKTQVHEALMLTQQQSEELHKEMTNALISIRKVTDEQLKQAEEGQRQRLEYTLKTVTDSETQLKQNILELSGRVKEAIESTATDIHGLQNNTQEMQKKIALALEGQANTIKLMKKIEEVNERLRLKILGEKPLTAPGSAPIGGSKGLSSLRSSAAHSPQSALEGREKRSWFSRNKKNSAKVSPAPLSQALPGISEGEQKRKAQG
jgi:hypothetical protein